MGKPTAEHIIFTYGDIQYRSTLKATAGRGRNSAIMIKRVGNSRSVSEILLRSISPESEERLFKLISQGWWIEFKETNSGDNTIHPEVLENFKFLVSQGITETYSLRASIELNNVRIVRRLSMQNLFNEFVSTGGSFLRACRGLSDFEIFIKISSRLNVETAKKLIVSAGSDRLRLDSIYSAVSELDSDSPVLDHLHEMTTIQLKNLRFFHRFLYADVASNDLVLVRFILQVPDSQWKTIESQVSRANQNSSVKFYVDEQDAPLWLSLGGAKGVTELMQSCVAARRKVDWDRLLCTLTNIYSLRTLIDTLNIFKSDTSRIHAKDVVNLINVANFLENGGSVDTPMSWILALSEPTNDSDDDDLESTNTESRSFILE